MVFTYWYEQFIPVPGCLDRIGTKNFMINSLEDYVYPRTTILISLHNLNAVVYFNDIIYSSSTKFNALSNIWIKYLWLLMDYSFKILKK